MCGISFLDGVFGIGVVAQNAAGNTVKALIVPPASGRQSDFAGLSQRLLPTATHRCQA
jgi:hypothetical protein